jgi:Abortive infection alpha
MDEQAKAIQEVAKVAGKAIDAASGVGNFLDRVFGDLLTDSVGLVGDKVKARRVQNLIKLQHRVEANLQEKGIVDTRPVLQRIGTKLIDEAVDVESDYLRQRWANLLTNAMDPNFEANVPRNFITILADMEPLDVKVFDFMLGKWGLGGPYSEERRDEITFNLRNVMNELQTEYRSTELSFRNLMRLGLIKAHITMTGLSGGQIPMSFHRDTEEVNITLTGFAFYAAVS